MASTDKRGHVKQAMAGFLALLIASFAEGKFLSLSLGVAAILLYVFSFALPLNPKLALVPLGLGGGYLLIREPGRLTTSFILVSAALAAFVLFTVVSVLASSHMQQGYVASLSFAPALFLFFLVGTRFRPEDIRWLANVIILLCAVLSSIVLIVAIGNPSDETVEWVRLAGFPQFGVPNDLLILSILAPFVLIPLFDKNNAALRWASVVAALLVLMTMIVYQSRGGVMILILSSLTIILLLTPRNFLVAFFVLVGSALAIDALTGFALTQRFLHTFSARVPLWLAAWAMFQDAPLLGHGPGSFSVLGPDYLQSVTIPDWVHRDPRHAPWPHNLYLELMAERGLIGLGSFSLLIALGFRYSVRAYNHANQGVIRAIAAALIAALIALGIAGFFELSATRHWFINFSLLFLAAACVLASTIENG